MKWLRQPQRPPLREELWVDETIVPARLYPELYAILDRAEPGDRVFLWESRWVVSVTMIKQGNRIVRRVETVRA
jgi:hypothetical protein